jgi:hypothetical protein
LVCQEPDHTPKHTFPVPDSSFFKLIQPVVWLRPA